MPTISLEQASALANSALQRAGACAEMAVAAAAALVAAEAQGLASHGLSRVPQYAAHLRHGRANGAARPRATASPSPKAGRSTSTATPPPIPRRAWKA
jgi:(2R)-3-sulfolactate dehydrogenase (NADP+)